jgi:hypothetical protein
MPLPPIAVQLSAFEQIEILRHEIEQFEEDLKKTEVRIRELLYLFEKQRFLQTVHPLFQHAPAIAGGEQLPELYGNREALAQGLEAMKQALAHLEATAGPAPARPAMQAPQRPAATRAPGVAPGAAPQPGAGVSNPGLRRNRFDAF